MRKFWNWVNDGAERVLYLNGTIAEDSWYDDDVTPALFKAELEGSEGPVTVYVNSPGGDCIAASQIYTMIREYPFPVIVKIDGLAASAASVIAMAGDKVLMSPTSLLMLHNPAMAAFGDYTDMQRAIDALDEVKQSILNAYELKTGLDRKTLARLMDEETWLNANKAVELGFADGILEGTEHAVSDKTGIMFSQRKSDMALINKVTSGIPAGPLYDRLDQLRR